MIVTTPIPITDAILTSSTVQEPDAGETLWVSTSAYAIDDVRLRPNHRKYRCVKAIPANTVTPPENDAFLAGETVTAAKSWQDIGATNRRAMFELERNTVTTSAGTMTVVLTPGQRVGSLFLGGMQATKVTVVVTLAGQEIYRRAVSRIARRTTSWKTYFFGKFIVLPSLLLADLPPSTGAVITVTLENSFGSPVKCAALVIGNGEFIGNVQKKAKSDALNFSNTTRDFAGNVTFVPRRTVPRTDQVLELPKGLVNTVRDLRTALNAKVAVWSGLDDFSDDGYFESLLILGFYRQFSIDLDQQKEALVTLELEEI
ncbi:hypothetical protein [Xylophilus sp. Leaf220]|uniref:hypothetical protein n=1 Tax=Xylophilus sp. Leaf220 TaxID=1735686 RepID=UPI0006FED01C|nr:hypothetical protein [Xylophilus sp. Leaf220]KQM68772.1 hypothetical protein ASE76_13830 [Xylophilus sp. Leaf220]